MRPQHLLHSVKSDAYPTQVICVDCDYTWAKTAGHHCAERAVLQSWVGVGFSGSAGVYGKEVWHEGKTAKELWEKIYARLSRGGTIWCFSERSSLVWSLLDLWQMVESREVDLCGTDDRDIPVVRANGHSNRRMRCVLEDPPFIVELRKKPLPGTLKILSVENYGIQPSPDGRDFRDRVRRVHDFVCGMVGALKDKALGSLKDTAGSQSMYSFKRRHLTHLMQAHNNERALNIEGDSYYGGRCETFRLGRIQGEVYHLDVTAMYPYCYGANKVPISLAGVDVQLGPGDQPQLGAGCGIIAEVTVETDEPAYPFRDSHNGITVWPIGVFRTVLAGPELMDALSRDRVIRWHRAAWYYMEPALASYSRCVLEMRREYADNDDLKAWAKQLGVCIVGKLGQRDKRWVDAPTNLMHEPWGTFWHREEDGTWTRYRSISNYTQRETLCSWSFDALPAISSWVCSIARMRLLNMIRCASWEETYYCDTDALMVSRKGYSNLVRAGWVRYGEPGTLRVKNVSNVVEIHGIKAYDEEGRSVRAGQPVLSAGIWPGGCRYWARRPARIAAKEGFAPSTLRVAIRHDKTGVYRHGEVCADGTVTPFQLNQE